MSFALPGTQAEMYSTRDPRVFEYVMSREKGRGNFDNFVKGTGVAELSRELLGEGIFAVDGHKWLVQRKLASGMFTTRFLRDEMTGVFATGCQHLVQLLSSVGSNHPVDMYDLFNRFTLDHFVELAFGVHLGQVEATPSLHSKRSVTAPAAAAAATASSAAAATAASSSSSVAGTQPAGVSKQQMEESAAFAVAFDAAQNAVFRRFTMPIFAWKLMRLLNVGFERRFANAMKVINAFAARVIASKRASTYVCLIS